MDIGVIARRYARALLAYATEQKADATVYSEMLQLVAEWRAEPRLAEVMHDPTLTPDAKVKALAAAAAPDASDVFRRFAAMVVARRRESLMLFVAHSFIDLYRDSHHIRIGRLTTATPIDDNVRQRITQWIGSTSDSGYDIRMETSVNPDIVGGFILQVDDRRLDASVATQFERIKKHFVEKNKQIV